MCVKDIRLPDGRVITPATDREELLNVLEDVLHKRIELPLRPVKLLARWALNLGSPSEAALCETSGHTGNGSNSVNGSNGPSGSTGSCPEF